ncbi:sn-glycerol-3-phosphate ABC transporter ATP-binding protein UgpC [Mesorhizobium sp.]|uniref:ABC transporter ATP-binding protein n=1 Tax=Mesorhizobium sp. TaxID=1871066 RepID=UPI000FE4240D|nr:sn-glycerol-3-phosphate ABC transporter ATP-binding protein UgpC [Mesorhizobium sp.]RWC06149.1 MAG: sn-glycerol-3-phosphate ABC transporter ATP-binding protein UgpC [Mesorhizobium sp.]RWP09091.1 MAG: sn-glycerol-3-phosphate ABC transporter ATP-binding protein UgpC [Mesorhizobium sp.]RWP32578.1 MAG: sn-glycerol-3-phosphate ABC transporter ATP-binding protein UgpC [Mesorhizobium sp.]RWP67375.1 MAG: sn-glycerol-3-phosphate ABC transporter ATP-binding protein UgpC [Mesorhizobium sp.]RWQ24874.1 
MATVEYKNIAKNFGNVEVMKDISFGIADREFVVLLGPSGCGKTTLLRMTAGLERVTSGDLLIGDRRVNDVHPRDRDIAMVFQNYALYPTMKVFDNIGFSLEVAKVPKAEIRKKVEWAAEILNLTPYLGRYPKELSGGQRQRVAMGRAMVRNAAVFLFDEPLSNLDAKLRTHMRVEIRQLHNRLGTTTIYVTHDQIEAMTMADKIVLMHAGRIMQIGTPDEVYERPNSKYVADFIGSPSMNFIAGAVETAGGSPRFVAEGVSIGLSPQIKATPGQKVIMGVRPHDLGISDTGEIKGEVVLSETTGADVQIHLRVAGYDAVAVVPRDERRSAGAAINLSVLPGKVHLFDAATELRVA